jgi:hypothetical protein
MDKTRRKELRAQAKETRPLAGVYRMVNTRTGKALLATTTNLPNVQSKLEFSQSTKTANVLDLRLHADIRLYGIESFTLEVLETLEVIPEMTPDQIKDDLKTLEELWREKFGEADLY